MIAVAMGGSKLGATTRIRSIVTFEPLRGAGTLRLRVRRGRRWGRNAGSFGGVGSRRPLLGLASRGAVR